MQLYVKNLDIKNLDIKNLDIKNLDIKNLHIKNHLQVSVTQDVVKQTLGKNKQYGTQDIVKQILSAQSQYGRSKMGRNKLVLLETVSSMPRGPLLVSHGRLVIVGDVVANLLEAVGFKIYREYYVNDAVSRDVSGQPAFTAILADMREDIKECGVHYDNWVLTSDFSKSDILKKFLQILKEHHHVYEKGCSLWLHSVPLGDVKDRLLVDSAGQATDFAYHAASQFNKLEREFDIAINVFSADDPDNVAGIKAAMQAANINPERLIYLLVQGATHHDHLLTLRQLRDAVGNDVVRFFSVMRKYEKQMDVDLDLAQVNTDENPVYYLQQAYATMCGIFKQLAERGWPFDEGEGLSHLNLLMEEPERQLCNTLSRYPDIIVNAALQYEPCQLTHYLHDVATDFYAYAATQPFFMNNGSLRNARLSLLAATQQTMLNGFNLLGISNENRF